MSARAIMLCRFNAEFGKLVQQKHTDADRLTDLNTRADELVRELVNIHMVLNPVAAASDPAPSTGPDAAAVESDAAAGQANAGSTSSETAASARAAAGTCGSGPNGAQGGAAAAAEQLLADLAAGQLLPYWSPEEDLESQLLKVQPGEVKVRSGL
jgi:hypothetical protein